MLGLGLGLNKGGYIKPLPKWLTDAGCTFAINVDRQVKALANPNSPFINPLVDVVGKLGKNLFDSANATYGSGKRIDESNGLPIPTGNIGDGNCYTNYIRIKPNTSFKLSGCSSSTYCPYAIYDDNKNYLYGFTEKNFTTPNNLPNGGYIRFSFYEIDKNTIQLEEGTVATTYEPYGFNNVLLQSFAGTSADGYTQIALPNGKNPWFLKFDGTDSLGIMANTADVDILGTNDFAISTVFRTASVLTTGGYLIAKNLDLPGDFQYAIAFFSTTGMVLFLNTTQISIVPVGTLQPDTLYELIVYRIGGELKSKLNKVERYNQPNTTVIVTKPNLRIGARSSNSGGTLHAAFTNPNIGNIAIFYNGAIGLDIAKVEKAVAKLNANYI